MNSGGFPLNLDKCVAVKLREYNTANGHYYIIYSIGNFMGDATTMSTPYPVWYKEKKTACSTYIHTSHKLAHFWISCYCSLSHSLPLCFSSSFLLLLHFSFSTLQIHRFVATMGHGSWWLIDDDSKPFKPNIKRWKLWSIPFRKALIFKLCHPILQYFALPIHRPRRNRSWAFNIASYDLVKYQWGVGGTHTVREREKCTHIA